MIKAREKGERRKPWRRRTSIKDYIPQYLRRCISPYGGDFCYTTVFHFRLIAQLMSEGFLPIAAEGVLLPKLHAERCVISLPNDLHVSKSVRKKSKRFSITINKNFDKVIDGCKKQHGSRCWLYPPLVEEFKTMNENGSVEVPIFADGTNSSESKCPVRLYSIEVWNNSTGELVGGELGYSVGSIYTSLTGFASQDSAGSVQLAALGRLLSTLGFSIWDLGMEMDYKTTLGSKLMPRDEFVACVRNERERKGGTVLPSTGESFDAKSLIDQTYSAERLLVGNSLSNANDDKNESKFASKTHTGIHKPPFDQEENSSPNRKKMKNLTTSHTKERVH